MALVTKTKTWVDEEGVNYDDMNANFDTLYTLVNGALDNANIAANAAISATKIAFGSAVYTKSVISLSTGDIWVANGKDEFTIPATIGSGKWVIETVEAEVDVAPGTSKTLTLRLKRAGSTIKDSISITNTAVLTTGHTPSSLTLSAGNRLTLDITTATSGIATTRCRLNIVVKQYLTT